MSGQHDPGSAEPGARRRRTGVILAAVAAATLVAGAGCAKSAPKQDSAGGGAAAGGTGCAAGAARNDEGGFCVKVPANEKMQNAYDSNDTSRTYEYGNDSGHGITVVVSKLDDASNWDFEVHVVDDESKSSGKTQQQSSDLPGGGKFWSWVDEDGKTWVTALTHKDKKLLFCRTFGKPVDAALVDACKSIRPL
jgi:hypothetical protein